jgi:hypothetical protein
VGDDTAAIVESGRPLRKILSNAGPLAVIVDDPDAPGGDFHHWPVV